MVGGTGTEGPCLGSAFCHELSEVVLNPLKLPFAKEGRGRGALEREWTGGGQERGWGKAVGRAILGLGLGLPQTLGLRMEDQGLGTT